VSNENLGGIVLEGYVPMVRRAFVGWRSNTGDTISIDFASNDPSLFSGYVWFYDSGGSYVGRSDFFRAYGSGADASFVNGGSGLHNDGSTNSPSTQAGNAVYQTGRTFPEIVKFHAVLTDGAQYPGTSSTCDCRSIGALFEL
jgi:hypothetical protein